MKNLIIYGGGDFGEELIWYINEINAVKNEWNLIGFVDDGLKQDDDINGYKVLGGLDFLLNYDKEIHVVCSIALPHIKEKIVNALSSKTNIKFPNIIHPSAQIAPDCKMGEGVCIGPNCIVSIKTSIGNHVVIKQLSSIGHHSSIGEYSFIAPCCALAGHVKIGKNVDLGIGCKFKLLSSVGDDVILGAGAVVIKDIPSNCTAVGIPAKPIKFREE